MVKVTDCFSIKAQPSGLAPKYSRERLYFGARPQCAGARLRLVSRPIPRVIATLRVATWVRTAADSLGLGSCDLGSSLVSPAQLGHLVQLLARRTYTPSEVRLIYSQLGEP